MKKIAFTLAEVLITLTVVGVVVALTMPSLMKLNHQAGLGASLASMQNILEESVGRVMFDNPKKSLDANSIAGDMSKYLMTASGASDVLKNGATLSYEAGSGSVPAGSAVKDVIVDLNGANEPNVEGVDKFRFTISSHGMAIPRGCASVIAKNNWRVPKDYNSATCSGFTDSYSSQGVNGEEDTSNCQFPAFLTASGSCCDPKTQDCSGVEPNDPCEGGDYRNGICCMPPKIWTTNASGALTCAVPPEECDGELWNGICCESPKVWENVAGEMKCVTGCNGSRLSNGTCCETPKVVDQGQCCANTCNGTRMANCGCCESPKIIDENGACVEDKNKAPCKGTKLSNGICCARPQVAIDDVCCPSADYVVVNGECQLPCTPTPCLTGFKFNEETCKCEFDKCPSGYHYTGTRCITCDEANGYYWNATTKACTYLPCCSEIQGSGTGFDQMCRPCDEEIKLTCEQECMETSSTGYLVLDQCYCSCKGGTWRWESDQQQNGYCHVPTGGTAGSASQSQKEKFEMMDNDTIGKEGDNTINSNNLNAPGSNRLY